MSHHASNPPPLAPGQSIEHRYYVRTKIGDGAFADVYSATDTVSMEEVALKLLHNDRRRMAARERRVLHQLGRADHPNIIRLLRYFTTTLQGALHPTHILSYPLLAGTLLSEIKADRLASGKRGGLAPDKLEPGLRAITAGLAFLEEQRIVHMDLKPENILRAIGPPTRLVLADFGNAARDVANEIQYEAQTPWYRAPEVCLPAKYGAAVDLWSLGCIAYEMETGVPLFTATTCEHLTYLHNRALGPPPAAFLDLAEQTPACFSRQPNGTVTCRVRSWHRVSRAPKVSPRSPTLRTHLLLDGLLSWMPNFRPRATQLMEWKDLCTPQTPTGKGLDLENVPN
jgi:serine/threonine protein kinase